MSKLNKTKLRELMDNLTDKEKNIARQAITISIMYYINEFIGDINERVKKL
jgi:hypothetical protein